MRTIMAILSLPLVGGCPLAGKNCNDMYAPSGVDVAFLSDTWAPGLWELEVEGETCVFTLPGADDVDCSTVLWPRFDADRTRMEAVFLSEQTPDVVEIVLTRDGVEVDAVSVQAIYVQDEPNGPGCGVRDRAEEEVDVDVG